MFDKDTIVAPATAFGEGGIGIVRLSGPMAGEYLKRAFRTPTHQSKSTFSSHHFYYGHIVNSEKIPLDEVMVVFMKGPKSYTCEDVVEIHCHGGSFLIRSVIDMFVELGARIAKPGEFTFRAFLNGRIDLSRAEAVIDLINARSETAARVALNQLDGFLYNRLQSVRETILGVLALVEAYIDFPDEDIDLPHITAIAGRVQNIIHLLHGMIESFDTGRVLKEGLSVLILGRPNVGKSSLLNVLLGESRAIVTDVPGTTRDFIEESIVIGGFPLRLVDTAGIRETSDVVEAEGVRRAREKITGSDLVLLVVDGSMPLTSDDHLAFEFCEGQRFIVIINKSDLDLDVSVNSFTQKFFRVFISARQEMGIDLLSQSIVDVFGEKSGKEIGESVLINDRRHKEALVGARRCLTVFLHQLEICDSPELLAVELRDALDYIGQITGETTPDEVLDHIFDKFCIGK